MDETQECTYLRSLLSQPTSEAWFQEVAMLLASQLGELIGEPTLRELLLKKLRKAIQEAGLLDYEEVGKTDHWSKCTVTFNGKLQEGVIWADAATSTVNIWDKGTEKLLQGKVKIEKSQQLTFF
jgi:hypothetical protein